MTGTPASRRGSWLETWRLFFRHAHWLPVLSFLAMCLPVALVARTPNFFFVSIAVTNAVLLVIPIWSFEERNAESFAFITLMPQPVQTKWLVLLPMCLTALVAAGATARFGKLPAVAALSLLGCAWWTIGIVRWFGRVRRWVRRLVPLQLLACIAAYLAYRVGGWEAAAAVAMALGVGALVVQPPAFVGIGTSQKAARNHALGDEPARIPRPAVSDAGVGRPTWLDPARGFWLLNADQIGKAQLVLLAMMLFMVASWPFAGRAAQFMVLVVLFGPGRALAHTYSGDMREFLRPRPLAGRQLFVGAVQVLLPVALLMPAIGFCVVSLEWIEATALPARIFRKRLPNAIEMNYLRDVLGATFMPDTWPAGGLPPSLWMRLRPLLYLDVLRETLLVVAALFAWPARAAGSDPRGSYQNLIIPFSVLAITYRLSLDIGAGWVPVPPLWFVALLAAATIARWSWRVRVVNAPSRARDAVTGSSTAG